MSRAWMPLYVADYIADTRRLSLAEHGAYMLLIMEYWRNGGLPNDDKKLARIIGITTEEWLEIRDNIADFFDDEWKHNRIEKELSEANQAYQRRANAGRKGAIARQNSSNATSNATSNDQALLKQSQSQSQSQLDSINTIVNADAVDNPVSSFEKVKRVKDERNVDLIQTVVGDWNNLAANLKLPQVSHITPQRQSNILRRAKELVEYYDYAEPIAGFQDLFSKIRGSPFLRGDTGKFRADLDFAITLSSFTKIMENRYEALQPKTVYRK